MLVSEQMSDLAWCFRSFYYLENCSINKIKKLWLKQRNWLKFLSLRKCGHWFANFSGCQKVTFWLTENVARVLPKFSDRKKMWAEFRQVFLSTENVSGVSLTFSERQKMWPEFCDDFCLWYVAEYRTHRVWRPFYEMRRHVLLRAQWLRGSRPSELPGKRHLQFDAL